MPDTNASANVSPASQYLANTAGGSFPGVSSTSLLTGATGGGAAPTLADLINAVQANRAKPSISDTGLTAAQAGVGQNTGLSDILNAPIIKSIVDAISTGTYASANYADSAISTPDERQAKLQGDLNKGDVFSAALDAVEPNNPGAALIRGVSAGFGQNSNDAKSYSDVISRAQTHAGIDPTSDSSKLVQGVGGFAGDVALDPTSFLNLGISGAIKGAATGLRDAGGAAARDLAKGAEEASTKGVSTQFLADPKTQTVQAAQDAGRFKSMLNGAKGGFSEAWKENLGIAPKEAVAEADAPAVKQAVPVTVPDIPNAEPIPTEPIPAPKPIDVTAPVPVAEELKDPVKDVLDKVPAVPTSESVEPKATKLNDVIDGIYKEENIHQGMKDIHENIPFKEPVYSANKAQQLSILHDAAKPSSVEEEVTREVPAPKEDAPVEAEAPKEAPKLDMVSVRKDLMNGRDSAEKITFDGKPTPKKLVYNKFLKTDNKEQETEFFGKLGEDYLSKFRERQAPKSAPKPAAPTTVTEKVTREVPGTPVTSEMLNKLGIAEEHHGLSPEELTKVMKPTADKAKMGKYITDHATPEEVAYIKQKLNLPDTVHKTEASKKFVANIPAYKKALAAEKAEAKKISPKTAAAEKSIVEDAVKNTETHEALGNIPIDVSHLARANTAIDALEHISQDITLHSRTKGETITVTGKEMRDSVHNIVQAFNHYQSGIERPFTTGQKYKSFTKNSKTGGAVHPGRPETQASIALNSAIIQEINKIAKNVSAFDKVNLARRLAGAVDAQVHAIGLNPYLNLGRQSGELSNISLGFSDILGILPTDIVNKHLIGGRLTNAVQSIAMMTGVENLLRGRNAVNELVKAGETVSDEDYKKLVEDRVFHALAGYREGYGSDVAPSTMNAILGRKAGIKTKAGKELSEINNGIHQFVMARVKASDGAINYDTAYRSYLGDMRELAHSLSSDTELAHAFEQRSIFNDHFHNAEVGKLAIQASQDVMDKLTHFANNPVSVDDWIKYLDNTVKDTLNAMPEEARNAALAKIEELKAKHLITPIEERALRAKKNTTSMTGSAIDGKAALDADSKAYPDDIPETHDLFAAAIATDMYRRIHPVQAFLNPRFGFDTSGMYIKINSGMHTIARDKFSFEQQVVKHFQKNPNLVSDMAELQRLAREHIASGSKEAFMPEKPSVASLYKVLNPVWNVGNEGFFSRAGIPVAYFNQVVNTSGLRKYFPDTSEINNIADIQNIWHSAEALDSNESTLDFLSRSYHLAQRISNDVSVASHFMKTFGSDVPKDGFKKISWSSRQTGRASTKAHQLAEKQLGFYELLDKDKYYETKAASEIPTIHRMMNESRSIDSSKGLGRFFTQVFDPITGVLKSTQTTLRPGHWISNLLGDTIRNHLAGVNSVVPYMHNLRVLRSIGHDISVYGASPEEAYARITGKNFDGSALKLPEKDGNLFYSIGGKRVGLSATYMGRRMEKEIYMAGAHGGIHEDYEESPALTKFASTLTNATNKIVDNQAKIGNVKLSLNYWSAMRDNFTRGALALDVARKGNWKSEDDMFNAMSEAVRKWAPTSMDFTAKEAKYARRTLLYYTWLRGMIPNIMELALDRPGYALTGNKALFEFAKSNGVSPASLGNPFPPNQAFPSYYYENVLGPQIQTEGGQLWGFSPMSPFIDVLDTIGQGVTPAGLLSGKSEAAMGNNLIGMSTPAVKLPLEIFTGQSSGVPIKDNFQYLQDQLDGSVGNLISKGTGRELYAPWEKRTDANNGSDPNVAIANFLSGLRITNYNGPAAERSVRGENTANKSVNKLNAQRNS